jgi:hypothetical protein
MPTVYCFYFVVSQDTSTEFYGKPAKLPVTAAEFEVSIMYFTDR